MKILCLIRQVPDAEAKVKAVDGKVDLDGATMALDGMDEYGVEQALRINEGGVDTVAVALGGARFEDAIRRALAMGIERAIHIETEEFFDVVSQAKILKAVVQSETPDVVFVGGQHADTDSQALGAAVAEALGWNQITWTTELSLENGIAKATHDTDDGKESLSVALPVVVTTQQGLNEPRYPTLPNIMKAKKKEIRKSNPADYGVQSSKVRIVAQEIQERPRLNKLLDGKDPVAAAEQLVKLLHEEAKVI
ncbi:MAG: electron transfer flavoprotein subunit beta/FixA family protein [Deinococcales bacterium]